MTITLTQQLACALAVLEQMQSRQSRWAEAQRAIVATLDKLKDLEEISREIVGGQTKPAEVTK